LVGDVDRIRDRIDRDGIGIGSRGNGGSNGLRAYRQRYYHR
jgi:hypothetical protein